MDKNIAIALISTGKLLQFMNHTLGLKISIQPGYSETSDKGHSERGGQTLQQGTCSCIRTL